MRARSTRFAGSVRDREISTNARRWSASTDNAIIRRAATMAPPAMPQCFIPHIAQIGYLDTTYRQLGIFPLVISFVAGLVLHRFREKIAWSSRLCFIMAALSLLLLSVPHGLRFAAVPSGYVTIYLRLLNPW